MEAVFSMIEVRCHCQNVTLTFGKIPETITQCNCSICRRYSVQWMYFDKREVIVNEKVRTKQYIWGDKEIAFHHCGNCGCVTHYTMLGSLKLDRIAVNANLLELELLKNVKIRKFNGAAM